MKSNTRSPGGKNVGKQNRIGNFRSCDIRDCMQVLVNSCKASTRHMRLSIRNAILFVLTAAIFCAFAVLHFRGTLLPHQTIPKPSTAESQSKSLPGRRSTGADESSQPLIDTVNVSNASTPKFTAYSQPEKVTSQYVSAQRAVTAMRLVDNLERQGNSELSRELARDLDSRCGHTDGFAAPFKRTEWALEKLQEYCSEYEPPPGSEDWIDDLSPSAFKSRKELLDIFRSVPFSELEDVYIDFVTNAETLDDFRAARNIASYLSNRGAPLSLGASIEMQTSARQLKRIQYASLTLYGCQKFGSGCGPNDFETLQTCMLTGQCERGWSLIDYYANSMSPSDFDRAMDTVAFLTLKQDN